MHADEVFPNPLVSCPGRRRATIGKRAPANCQRSDTRAEQSGASVPLRQAFPTARLHRFSVQIEPRSSHREPLGRRPAGAASGYGHVTGPGAPLGHLGCCVGGRCRPSPSTRPLLRRRQRAWRPGSGGAAGRRGAQLRRAAGRDTGGLSAHINHVMFARCKSASALNIQ